MKTRDLIIISALCIIAIVMTLAAGCRVIETVIEEQTEEEVVIEEEPISFEAQLNHDMEVKYIAYCKSQSKEKKPYKIDVTQEDIDLMARVVMSEASICSQNCKQAVAQTIVNRVLSDKFPDTVEEVIEFPGAYSTAYNGEPTEECYEAVKCALQYTVYPSSMYYFRADHYHSFAKDFMEMDNTYFSVE